MHDVVVSGVRILTQDGVRDGKVFIDGGRISSIGDGGGSARVEFDGDGSLLVPGLLDDHVHFREPGKEEKEGFLTGSLAAAHGGITTAFEIQNNAPLMLSREAVESKLSLVRSKSRINIGLYGNANRSSVSRLGEMADAVMGFKVFLAPSHGDDGVDSDVDLRAIFENATRSGKVVVIHAEDRASVEAGERNHAADGAAGWSKVRSAAAEVLACERALRLAEETGARIHIFHLSSAGAVDLVAEAREKGVAVTAATCPHYLVFTDADVARVGGVLKCNPSIKGEVDRTRLREGVRDGILEVIESDHAPHLPEEKSAPFAQNPSGISSADVFLPILLHLVEEGVLTLQTMIERARIRPAEIFGYQGYGWLAKGSPADFSLVEDSVRWCPTGSDFASKASSSPWVGFDFPARVKQTFVGGKVAWPRDA